MKKRRGTLARQAVAAYLSELGLIGRSARTVDLQTRILHPFVKGVGADRSIKSISRADVTFYLGKMTTRCLSQSYIGITGKTIKRFFNWAVEQGILESNPLQGMKITMGPDKPILPFTDDECRRLIAAANTPLQRAVILLLMDSGLRASELASLRLRDIDLLSGEITVMGKGSKQRQVALNDRPRQALKEYLMSSGQHDGLLWPEGWSRTNLGTLIDSVARRAHVSGCHPHRFRHNWAVRMRRDAVDAIDLQRLLGHASLRMTLRYIAIVEGEVAVQVHKQHSVLPAA